MRKSITVLLIILSLVLILFGGYNFISIISSEKKEKDEATDLMLNFKKSLKDNTVEIIDEVVPTKDPNNKTPDDLSKEAFSKMIGIISIPSMELEAPVALGATDVNLKKYVGMYEEFGEPGELGNTILAAHSSIYSSCGHCYFQKMGDRVKVGDKVELLWEDGKTYVYTVYKVENFMSPDYEAPYVEPEDKEILTLVTCTNGDPNQRTFIQAERE